jgi:hypothetical protein
VIIKKNEESNNFEIDVRAPLHKDLIDDWLTTSNLQLYITRSQR